MVREEQPVRQSAAIWDNAAGGLLSLRREHAKAAGEQLVGVTRATKWIMVAKAAAVTSLKTNHRFTTAVALTKLMATPTSHVAPIIDCKH